MKKRPPGWAAQSRHAGAARVPLIETIGSYSFGGWKSGWARRLGSCDGRGASDSLTSSKDSIPRVIACGRI